MKLDKSTEIEKIYWTITEVALMFDVNASAIRFWEKNFDILKPKKNHYGDRVFVKKDIENLKKVHHLLKVECYTIEGAQKKLKEEKSLKNANADIDKLMKNPDELRKYLINIRNFMEELRKNL